MDPIEIEAICKDRLGRWTKGLVEQHATPILLIGIGHDHQEGNAYILTTEEITDEEIVLFLAGAMQIIASGKHAVLPVGNPGDCLVNKGDRWEWEKKEGV